MPPTHAAIQCSEPSTTRLLQVEPLIMNGQITERRNICLFWLKVLHILKRIYSISISYKPVKMLLILRKTYWIIKIVSPQWTIMRHNLSTTRPYIHNTIWYALNHMYLQIKAHKFCQAFTCISDVNKQIKYSNLALSSITTSHDSLNMTVLLCRQINISM